MPDQSSTDLRLALELKVTPDAVAAAREAWENNFIMRHVINDAIKTDLNKRHVALETVTPEELKTQQGEISGIRFALGIVLKKES